MLPLYHLLRREYKRRTLVLAIIEMQWKEYNIANEEEVRRWGRNW